jgi:hypothetical protein
MPPSRGIRRVGAGEYSVVAVERNVLHLNPRSDDDGVAASITSYIVLRAVALDVPSADTEAELSTYPVVARIGEEMER